MQTTNIRGLPVPLARAIAHNDYDHLPGAYSVTSLVSPPRIRILRERHGDEIVEDVADRIWLFLGTAVHHVTNEWGVVGNALQEERLCMLLDGAMIAGKPDLYQEDGTVTDFKVTSMWSVAGGEVKPDWVAQLNCYAAILRWTGFPVHNLQVVAILRDYSANRALGNSDLPDKAVIALPVPLWSHVDAEEYLLARLRLHRGSEALKDEYLPECTAEERYQDPSWWAVMKSGRKSALKRFPAHQRLEAEAMAESVVGGYVEERPSEPKRCLSYCDVAPWCSWFRQWQANAAAAPEE